MSDPQNEGETLRFIDASRAMRTAPSTIDTELDNLIEELFPYHYPNYNLGLLPDEEDYDVVQVRDHYLTDEARESGKTKLKAIIERETARARIDELEQIVINAKGDEEITVYKFQIENRVAALTTPHERKKTP